MAGSYNHIVTRNGNLRSNEQFVNMIENLGDAYEMAEELFGMVWFLAQSSDDPKAAVEAARQGYEQGLRFAQEVNRP